ncbi:MAG TPA: hypothetical protein DCS88_11820 [Alphaproteobacteria bacterium]|nr:hypothetical protein [Alphaproteobacteria bacterium]
MIMIQRRQPLVMHTAEIGVVPGTTGNPDEGLVEPFQMVLGGKRVVLTLRHRVETLPASFKFMDVV